MRAINLIPGGVVRVKLGRACGDDEIYWSAEDGWVVARNETAKDPRARYRRLHPDRADGIRRTFVELLRQHPASDKVGSGRVFGDRKAVTDAVDAMEKVIAAARGQLYQRQQQYVGLILPSSRADLAGGLLTPPAIRLSGPGSDA